MTLRILAPTGVLGAGFSADAFERGVAARPDVIACDAGSTDSGPAALGSGKPKLSVEAMRRDLRLMLIARQRLGVPLIIGSCGTSGRDAGVDLVAGLAREIATVEGLSFRMALIYSDQDSAALVAKFEAGEVAALDPAPLLTSEILVDSHVVAMMGTEPIEAALSAGADVVLAGRASDTALFAAVPHLRGADPGLTWHMAKTIECGAACAVPPSADGLLVTLEDDHFIVETLAEGSRLTPRSVAAHSLYENADAFRVIEPAGVLDTTRATYEAVSDTAVRVAGAVFEPAARYSVKLEGARRRGFQTIAVGGIRDPLVIARLDSLIPMAKEYFAGRILELFEGRVDPGDILIDYTMYGRDGVLGALEPNPVVPHEVGVLIAITAPTQELAHSIATFVTHVTSHLPVPEYDGLSSTIAYPFSPPEVDRGAVYEFTLNHVLHPDTPTALFRTELEEVAP
jgi:hypothetical protein